MKTSIIKKINAVPNLKHLTGCDADQIRSAQESLSLTFPEEYLEYVKTFGAICFYGTEWTGLNVQGYLNTVEATNAEKSVNSNFPEGYFVIEDLGIDAKKAIVNSKGQVFILQHDKVNFLCESLSEYLNICIAKRK